MHPVSRPAWIDDRALIRFDDISLKSTALIVVDMQVIFVEEGQRFAKDHSASIVPNINSLSVAVRKGGGTVVFTRHTTRDDPPYAMPAWQLAQPRLKELIELFRPGTREHEIDGRMETRPEDVIIDKCRYSALTYNSSRLNDVLVERGIDTVIVVGVATNCCCETTARDASQLGYKTFFITDATATLTDDEHNAALVNLSAIFADTRSTRDMLRLCAEARG